MSSEVFPRFQGLTWDIKASAAWPGNQRQRSSNNAVTVLRRDPYPQWTFELTYEFLDGTKPGRPSQQNPSGYSELDLIVGLFNRMGGDYDTFLLDPGLLTGRVQDWEVHGVQIGVGDGTTATYYLVRDCGGFLDEVQDPVGPVNIAVNGTPVVNPSSGTALWTLADGGAITFATPPAAGAVITWDGRWRWRVRFPNSLEIDTLMSQLYELKSLKLEQDKR